MTDLDTTPAAPTAPEPGGAPEQVATFGQIRDLVLRAHPDVVPDLVQGDSIESLLASVEPARVAFALLAERIRADQPAPAPTVPAGGATGPAVDPAQLPALKRIKRGLSQRSA